ncbi:hypothetical protein TNCV_3023761 [Trichonephila clavipes]|nr:hypothetical protein TNCV_3023761 [Trichonephila clavipes]
MFLLSPPSRVKAKIMNEVQEGHCSSRANLVTEAAVCFGPSGDIGHRRGETHHRTEVRFGQKTSRRRGGIKRENKKRLWGLQVRVYFQPALKEENGICKSNKVFRESVVRPSEYTTAKTITIRAREVFRRIFVRRTEDMLKSRMMHLALSDVSTKAALTTKQEFIS